MRKIHFLVIIVSLLFFVGCTEDEWYELLCQDKDNSAALKVICWFQSPIKTHRYIIDASKCPGEGSYYDQVTEECLGCGKHAQLNAATGKCKCLEGYTNDISEGYISINCIKQADCSKDEDCVGKVSFGDTCSDSMTRLKPICFQQKCKIDYEQCEYGCDFKSGKCRKWADVPCVNVNDCRKYELYDKCATHKDIDSGTLYYQRHFWECITSPGEGKGRCQQEILTCSSLKECETGKCL